jgi:hypothetical protein
MGSAPSEHRVNRLREIGQPVGLGQHSINADRGLNRGANIVAVHGEKNYSGGGKKSFEDGSSFYTVHHRHGNIQQNEIGLKDSGFFHGFHAVGRFIANFEIFSLTQEKLEDGTDTALIVRD